MLARSDITAAAERINPYVRRTPTMRLGAGELPGDGSVVFKLEFMQHTGSFKARGAFSRMSNSPIPSAGVTAASGGNHGAAVAYAASRLGVKALIFVPQRTPETKVARIAGYGADIVRGGADYAEALAACQARQSITGALEVHAFDDAAVLAGQGGVGLELQDDAPELTHVLVAVGGGGLIGGIAGWYGASGVQVVGVEPEGCPCLHVALAAGHPIPAETSGIAADSLGARQVGDRMFQVAKRYGVGSVLVSDGAIRAAQSWLWERLRVVAEPGGAAALAGLLSKAWVPPASSRIGVVLCGANTDPGSVSREAFPSA